MTATNKEEFDNILADEVRELPDEALEGVAGGTVIGAARYAADVLRAYGYEVPDDFLNSEDTMYEVIHQFGEVASFEEKLRYSSILKIGGDSRYSDGHGGGRG